MKICTCEACRYSFRYPIIPTRCPDCGKKAVRPATESEVKSFLRELAIIEEEIRMGLYGAAV